VSEWRLYPNPTSGIVAIEGSCDAPSTVRIYNLLGAKEAELKLSAFSQSQKLTMPKLSAGVYVVEWVRPEGISTQRLIVQ
jgi:hypothetical protein